MFGDHVCLSGLPEDMPATFALFSSPLNVYPIANIKLLRVVLCTSHFSIFLLKKQSSAYVC